MVKTSNGVFLLFHSVGESVEIALGFLTGFTFRAGKLQFELPNLLLEIAECGAFQLLRKPFEFGVLGLDAFEWRK